MTPALHAACAQALHVVKADGAVLRAGRASLFILEGLGWKWSARILATPPLVWAVELGYRVVAANRSFFSRLLFHRGQGKA